MSMTKTAADRMTSVLAKTMSFPMRAALCFVAGVLTPFAFAPYHCAVIAVLGLAFFFSALPGTPPKKAGLLGYCFGLGMFGHGVSWLHVSINLFGGVPLIAAVGITLVLITFLALYPAVFAYLHRRFFAADAVIMLLTLPALWVLSEWCRGWLFTGFPWLSIGYSQLDTAIAAVAPVAGIHAMGFLTAFAAAVLAMLFFYQTNGNSSSSASIY